LWNSKRVLATFVSAGIGFPARIWSIKLQLYPNGKPKRFTFQFLLFAKSNRSKKTSGKAPAGLTKTDNLTPVSPVAPATGKKVVAVAFMRQIF
jgi:hypothetical protein